MICLSERFYDQKVLLFVRERHFHPVRGTINACFEGCTGGKTRGDGNNRGTFTLYI